MVIFSLSFSCSYSYSSVVSKGLYLNPNYRLLYVLVVMSTLKNLNQGGFAKFCMAASFTLVDLRFLVQQSFSLTPLRPRLAKVNKIHE